MGRMSTLADPTRLRLLRLLEKHELQVVDLCDILQLPQSTVSRHLRLLTDQGWLVARRVSQGTAYRMLLDELEPPPRQLWLLAREQTDGWNTTRQDALRLERRLKERAETTADFFARTAAEWEQLREQLYGARFTWQAMAALIDPDAVVADLACGAGSLAAELADHVAGVIAVDASSSMLRAARRRLHQTGNVDIRSGDLCALPIDSGTCDAALLVLALAYVADPAAAVTEAARILRPGGRLVMVDLLPHDREEFRAELKHLHRGFSPEFITEVASAAGLTRIAVRALEPQPDARGPSLFLATAARSPESSNRSQPSSARVRRSSAGPARPVAGNAQAARSPEGDSL